MFRTATFTLLFCICGVGLAMAQEGGAKEPLQNHVEQSDQEVEGSEAADKPQEQLSDAERITRLRRTIEENEQLLEKQKERLKKLISPEGEFSKAQAEFDKLDQELDAKKQELEKLEQQEETEQADTLQAELDALQKRRQLAEDRFELAIKERRALEEQITALQAKISQDKEALDKLLAPPTTQPAAPVAETPTTTPTKTAEQVPAKPEAAPPSPEITLPGAPTAPPAAEQAPTPQAAEPPSKELIEAREEFKKKEAELQQAQEKVEDVSTSIARLGDLIKTDKELRDTARQQLENALEEEHVLTEQFQKRRAEGAPAAEMNEIWQSITDTRGRVRQAREKLTELQNRVEKQQQRLGTLQAEQFAALAEKEKKLEAKKDTEKRIGAIQNPFSPGNLLQWLLKHGTKIVGILVAMVVLLWLARVAEHRIVKLIARRGGGGTRRDRENRAKTLVSVFHHAATWVIVIAGIFMILDEVGVPIGPLMGGAAVVGLAVAFGAQNLVRDYFSGFMILLESQYGINDVIKVGDVAGLVERVTLRVTVLRGLDGTVHFVPNGQINTVSNMTHGWSRALFDIGVAYKEDVDQVMKVLVQLGKELRGDPNFCHLILDDPEMLGVDEFGDSAVVIKFFIKTRPLQQWTVKRAMLRRIKKKFDELGIEIPFPHLTVYHRYEEDQLGQAAPPGANLAPGPRSS